MALCTGTVHSHAGTLVRLLHSRPPLAVSVAASKCVRIRNYNRSSSVASFKTQNLPNAPKRNFPRGSNASLPIVGGSILALALWFALNDNLHSEASAPAKIDVTELCRIVRRGTVEHLEQWLSRQSSEVDFKSLRHPMGWTPLHVAIVNNNVAVAKWLIEHGADVNAADEYDPQSNTRDWFECVQSRSREFASFIDPRASAKGITSLHYAALVGNPQLVQVLLDARADPHKRDASGHAPQEYIEQGNDKLKKLLDEYESNWAIEQKRLERERRLKYPLEEHLSKHVIGQQPAITLLSSTIRRRLNGWDDENQPLVFLFLGSSGIGKTETAKQLAKYLRGDDPEGFIRLDMSEFQSKHEVAKFIGSPPGYVGYEQGGQLTEKLKQNPNAVVLLDEVEKAHPDILSVCLQLFDEGRLTDGRGTTVSCTDAIFIMTSNLAQTEIANSSHLLRNADQSRFASDASPAKKFMETTIYPILKSHFGRDEFLGRVNEVLVFTPFEEKDLHALVRMELDKWALKAKERHNVTLEYHPDLIAKLAKGYKIQYGARSLKNEVMRQVINKVAGAHERGEFGEGGVVEVGVDGGGDVELSVKVTENKKSWLGGLFKG